MFRSLGALMGDLLVVILFVAVGMIQHGTPLTSQNLILVGWPFVVGLLLGHLAIRSWKAPFSLWPHGVFVWAITVVAAMALRTLLGQGTETSFVIVTAAVTGVLMLGWRGLAMYLTRSERRGTARVAPARAATPGRADEDEAEAEAETEAEAEAEGPADALDSGAVQDAERTADRSDR